MKSRADFPTDISAVIPTYNRCDTVGRAIRSVLHQSHPAREIIVIDDGSEDSTPDIIRRDFPEVRYLYQENQGISSARNRGISEAAGTWIAFLDSDDEWLPDKCRRQMDVLADDQSNRICHTDEIWIRNGRRVNPRKKHKKSGGYIFPACLPLCVISPSSVIIHRDIFSQYGVFDSDLPVCEDYDLWLRLCAFEPVSFIPEPLIKKYGGHRDQLSRRYPAMDRFRIQALEKIAAHPQLPEEYRIPVLKMILDKISIYISGAEKRGRTGAVKKYIRKYDHYSGLSAPPYK